LSGIRWFVHLFERALAVFVVCDRLDKGCVFDRILRDEAIDLLAGRDGLVGDQLELSPHLFRDHVEMAPGLFGAGLDRRDKPSFETFYVAADVALQRCQVRLHRNTVWFFAHDDVILASSSREIDPKSSADRVRESSAPIHCSLRHQAESRLSQAESPWPVDNRPPNPDDPPP